MIIDLATQVLEKQLYALIICENTLEVSWLLGKNCRPELEAIL